MCQRLYHKNVKKFGKKYFLLCILCFSFASLTLQNVLLFCFVCMCNLLYAFVCIRNLESKFTLWEIFSFLVLGEAQFLCCSLFTLIMILHSSFPKGESFLSVESKQVHPFSLFSSPLFVIVRFLDKLLTLMLSKYQKIFDMY